MSDDKYFEFRVKNSFSLFSSNSKTAQDAARTAAGKCGASVSRMDDSDTNISGWSGFKLKVWLNKEVDHASYIDAFKQGCSLKWGRNHDICEDSEDWMNKAHKKSTEVTSELMKFQQGATNFLVEAANTLSGNESAVIVISSAMEDYQGMQPYTLALKMAGYSIYQYNDTDMSRHSQVKWYEQWQRAATMAWKVLVFRTETWTKKDACKQEWEFVSKHVEQKKLRVCDSWAELEEFVENLKHKRVESWYQDKWSSTRLT